ncbi:putative Protein suppressor of white apricot [Hypsibius exemplaris]|uniref:SURP motif domain-containing protein n=1 Tax=Hypsibius exemplaris TaxID=2072580 RepID=A0A1W0WQP4_HYPEX|nr:putative Protein suppressor of white apricot [Hypsibius exemplaris]
MGRDGGGGDASGSNSHNRRPRTDLLVFGYASRIFHDDERARFFHSKRHLIPWMGDPGLLIDRYDGRGHLHDLQAMPDASRLPDGTLVGAELYGDQAFEELANEEAYRDLWDLQREETAREKAEHESEMEEDYLAATRTASPVAHTDGPVAKFGAVPFSYSETKSIEVSDNPPPDISTDVPAVTEPAPAVSFVEKKSDEVEIPFEPREDFDIPSNICLPQFDRVNSIIEKTALFIAEKGRPLEGIIRAKQANNDSFSFLSPKDALHPYYNFLVDAIKAGTYKPLPQKDVPSRPSTPPPPPPPPPESDSDSDDGDYLHPSLLRANFDPPKPPPAVISSVFSGASPSSTLYSSLIQTVRASSSRSLTASSVSMNVGPSPEVLAAIDKIVTYIVKNGESFEEMIKSRHGPDDPKFGFVHGYHPYHGLYDEKKRSGLAAAAKPKYPLTMSMKWRSSPNRTRSFLHRMLDEKQQHHTVGSVNEPQTQPLAPVSPKSAEAPPPPPPPTLPPPPPVPAPPEEDPRIAELKKKAREASLKIAERLKERATAAPPEVTPPSKTVEYAALPLSEVVMAVRPAPPQPPVPTVPRPVIAADPGSLLELLQLERPDDKKERENGQRKHRSRSSSSSSDTRRRAKKKNRHSRKRSRSPSRDKKRHRHGKKPRRSRS